MFEVVTNLPTLYLLQLEHVAPLKFWSFVSTEDHLEIEPILQSFTFFVGSLPLSFQISNFFLLQFRYFAGELFNVTIILITFIFLLFLLQTSKYTSLKRMKNTNSTQMIYISLIKCCESFLQMILSDVQQATTLLFLLKIVEYSVL